MFQRLRLWLIGSSELKEATRDAAREATREGLTEGFRLGVEDFIDQVTGNLPTEPKVIEANSNSKHEPLTAAELRGMRKADLLELAIDRGIDASEDWTVAQLKDELTAEPSAT